MPKAAPPSGLGSRWSIECRGCPLAAPLLQASVDLRARCLDDLRPFLVLGPDIGHELIRAHGLDFAAEIGKALLQLRRFQSLADFLVQLVRYVRRGALRGKQREPARRLELG